jgi:hypothetical protein
MVFQNHLKLVTGQLQLQSIFWKNGQLATQIEPGQPINLALTSTTSLSSISNNGFSKSVPNGLSL